MREANVLVVIVNYKTAPLVIECLASLEVEIAKFPKARVVVVDNPSGDDSVPVLQAAIRAHRWDWATVHSSPRNGGFSYGNNQAIREALASGAPPDFFWILNPDTQARAGALESLLRFLLERPEAGIAGSSYEDADGTPWPYAFRFPNLWSELDQGMRLGFVTRLLRRQVVAQTMGDVPTRVDWVAGASMMVRREVFERVGLMDEEYFLYFEETDFCLQAFRAGFETWYVPESRVMHLAGQSTGVTDPKHTKRRLPAYWFESRRRYFLKNHGRWYAGTTDVLRAVGFLSWRLRRPLQGKPDEDPAHFLRDLVTHSVPFGHLQESFRRFRRQG